MKNDTSLRNGLVLTPSGGTVYLGPARLLFEQTRQEVRELSIDLGAEEIQPSGLIETSTLKKVGYLRDFPHQISWVMHLLSPEAAARVARDETEDPQCDEISHSGCCLPSTVCHGLYSHLPLGKGIQLWTAESLCYRREKYLELGRRLACFHMREIIITGDHDNVLHELDRILDKTLAWTKAKALAVKVEQAQDSFFNPQQNPRSEFQKIVPVKREIRFGDLALASFNFHHNGIMKALRGEDQRYSACVAFGIDRIVSSLIS